MGLLAPPARASAYWRNISSGDIIILIESGCMGIIPTGESGGAWDEAPRGERGVAEPMAGGESNSSWLLPFVFVFKGAGAPVLMSLRAGPTSTSSRVSATGLSISS